LLYTELKISRGCFRCCVWTQFKHCSYRSRRFYLLTLSLNAGAAAFAHTQ